MLATVRLAAAAVLIAGTVLMGSRPAMGQGVDVASSCAPGTLSDWQFDPTGSGAGTATTTEASLLCNYRVSDDALSRGVPAAGAAITIEFRCEAEALGRLESVRGGATPQSGGGGGTYVLKEEFGSFSSNAGAFSRQHKLHALFSAYPRAFTTVVLYHEGQYNAARDLYPQAYRLVQANYAFAQQLSGCPAAGTAQQPDGITGDPCVSRPKAADPVRPSFAGGVVAVLIGFEEGDIGEPARSANPEIQGAGCPDAIIVGEGGSGGATGEFLRRGDVVSARDAFQVFIIFADQTVIRLGAGAVVRINPQGNGIHVETGRVSVKRGDVVQQALELTNPFVTKSPTAEVKHLDTLYDVSYDPATQTTTVRAIEGRLIVTPVNTALSAVTLTTGQQVLVSGDQISGVSALSGVRDDPFARLEEGQFRRAADEASSDGNGTVVFLLVGLLVLGIVGASIAVMSAQRAPATKTATAKPATAEPATGAPADPPGWYPDPTGEARMRYWDGIRWTESTSG